MNNSSRFTKNNETRPTSASSIPCQNCGKSFTIDEFINHEYSCFMNKQDKNKSSVSQQHNNYVQNKLQQSLVLANCPNCDEVVDIKLLELHIYECEQKTMMNQNRQRGMIHPMGFNVMGNQSEMFLQAILPQLLAGNRIIIENPGDFQFIHPMGVPPPPPLNPRIRNYNNAANRRIDRMTDDELYNYFTNQDLEDQHKIKGANERQIQKLVWKKYSEIQQTQDTNCVICQDDFEQASLVGQLPCQFNHTFHQDCIKNWLQEKAECPICREDIKTILKETESQTNTKILPKNSKFERKRSGTRERDHSVGKQQQEKKTNDPHKQDQQNKDLPSRQGNRKEDNQEANLNLSAQSQTKNQIPQKPPIKQLIKFN